MKETVKLRRIYKHIYIAKRTLDDARFVFDSPSFEGGCVKGELLPHPRYEAGRF